ncbi:hypothetical protein [Paenibacillus pabuli]|uniref:hypothetical protein n=1 Tax=Paenibacillus pabuli TaxID=1472 RepID=UPI002000088D|nr:hypothetical protein [Paenibacillus pabuli]UPK45201.1 hypothetical protein KET34_06815 [Paenibacillus pabuli]
MFENIVSDGIKSFSRLRNYMGKSNKKKVFSSPAISTIHKIVSKNTKFKNDNTMSKINKSNFIKKNKSLVKLIKGTGSLIAAAANQKSYSTGYGSNTNVKIKDSWFGNNVEWLKTKGKAGKDATFSWFGNNVEWLKTKGKAGKDATFSWFGNNVEWLKTKGKAGKDATFSWFGNNVEWLKTKGKAGKDATFSWFGNNVEWLKKKGKAGKDATFSWFGNNVEWLKKKGETGKDATFSWFGNNVEWLKKKGKAGKDATFSWFGNNVEWLKKKGKAGKDATFSWFGNNVEWLEKKGKAGKDATFSWFGNNVEWLKKKGNAGKNYLGTKWRQLKDWYKEINFKEKFNNFFDFTGTLNDFKDFGEKLIEFGKKRGWGVHSKIENMWSSPMVKKIRSFGKRAFPILDIGSTINDVAQAPTIDEKIIELNKAVFSKVGSAGLSAVGGFLGSFIPAQPATVPALAYGGSLLGDYLGEKLGELSGRGLTKIWPKTWWPYKKEKTSKINSTRNLNLNNGGTQTLVSSINKKSPSQHINVTLPTGAIQISNGSHKFDYNGMVAQISAHFVKELRRAMENRKTIMA